VDDAGLSIGELVAVTRRMVLVDTTRRGTCFVTEGEVGANRTGLEDLTGDMTNVLLATLSASERAVKADMSG
jgi:hypothetical protein